MIAKDMWLVLLLPVNGRERSTAVRGRVRDTTDFESN